MKKSIAILASLVVLGSAASSMAATAAVVNLNSYDSNFPVLGVGNAATVPADTMVEVLAQLTTGGAWVNVPTSTGATSWAVDDTSGNWDKGVGVIPGATAGANVTFKVQAWSGGTSYANSPLIAESATWSQATGSWTTDAQPPQTAPSITLAIPGSFALHNNVPEPTTIALGLLGAAALFIRRRK